MIDHACVKATTALFSNTVAFYENALVPLGYTKLREITGKAVGFGNRIPDFWVFASGEEKVPAHIALRAESREAVRKFHEAALKAGATDNGQPDLRPQLHADWYAAFIHDPAGNNVEAVCHSSE